MEIEPRLTVAQLAAIWDCSKQHIYNLIQKGDLPAVRIGSLIRLRPDDVSEYREAPMPRPRAEQPKYSLARRGKRYYVQWWEAGSAHRISCRTEIAAEARRFLAEFVAGRETPPPPSAPTIGEILDGYLSDRQPKVYSSSIRYDCATLKTHLGDLPADLLGAEQVQGYVQTRRRNGAGGAAARYRRNRRELSDGTLIRELGTLRAALAWGVRKRWITVAPYVERPENLRHLVIDGSRGMRQIGCWIVLQVHTFGFSLLSRFIRHQEPGQSSI